MKEFQEMLARGEFLESNLVHENHYGTSKQEVHYRLERGEDVVLDIDVQGAIQIKGLFSDAVMIFILPPSWEALLERLLKRESESAENLKIRLENAREEIRHLHEYDYIVVNDDLEKASEELRSIVIARRSKASRVIVSSKTSKILAGLPE
jgi:guanylate kinase